MEDRGTKSTLLSDDKELIEVHLEAQFLAFLL